MAEQPPKSPGLSPGEIHSQLQSLLVEKDADNEVIFDWIGANIADEVRSPQFIRTLMSLVCASAIEGSTPSYKVKDAVINKRGVLLQKYLDHQADLELQALYSLHALTNKLEYPQGLLRRFFEILYDEDIISGNAFCLWEKSKDPNEQEGKGVALKQVVQFFNWLQETEGETQDS